MHTRDGARIACACLRHGDSKDRKVVLKALKGFVARAAQDVYGALVLCAALEFIDDTVLLAKSVLAELQPELASLALQPQGCLPLLQLLAPRSSSHFTPEQLAIIGEPDGAPPTSAVRPPPRAPPRWALQPRWAAPIAATLPRARAEPQASAQQPARATHLGPRGTPGSG